MSTHGWWYVARAGGIVAWVLLTLSVVWGLLLSTRLLGGRPTPAWLTDLHRFLGGLAVVFTGVHVAGLVADNYVHFGWAETLVPFASGWRPLAVTAGVLAFYLLVAVEVTSLMMRRMPRRWWRRVHESAFLVFLLASLHGAFAGTDATSPAYRWVSVASIGAVVFLTVVRVLAGGRKLSTRRQPVNVAGSRSEEPELAGVALEAVAEVGVRDVDQSPGTLADRPTA
ncbi:MAG: ferric reductase-like transmembrane domain-containing protein [Acidimicrobiia bacterium]